MNHPLFFPVALLCMLNFVGISLTKKADNPTSITWDEWGVPNISAPDDEQLFYLFVPWADKMHSTQENSVDNGDQLQLFSQKKLREAYFYPDAVNKHKKRKEVMMNGRMKEEK